MISIRLSIVLLAVSLVVSTGILVATVSLVSYGELIVDARNAGRNGIKTTLEGAETDITVFAELYLRVAVTEIESAVKAWIAAPMGVLQESTHLLNAVGVEEALEKHFINTTLRGALRAKMVTAVQHGVTMAGVEAIPVSPQHPQPGTRGGRLYFMYADRPIAKSLPQNGSAVLLVGERGLSSPLLTYGESNEAGHFKFKEGCIPQPYYAKGEVIGRCVMDEAVLSVIVPRDELAERVRSVVATSGITNDPPMFLPMRAVMGALSMTVVASVASPAVASAFPATYGRYAYVFASLRGNGFSDILKKKKQHLPYGGVTYAVQRHSNESETLIASDAYDCVTTEVVVVQNVSYPISREIPVHHHVVDGNATILAEHARFVSSRGGYLLASQEARFVRWEYGVEYWTLVSNVTENGLSWFVCLLVPRNSLMKRMDESVRTTQSALLTSENRIETEQRKAFGVAVVVTFVCSGVLIAAAAVFTKFLTKPLSQLCSQMQLVALMETENIILKTESRLTEVDTMQRSFAKMVVNLQELRHYMPQTILQRETDMGETYFSDETPNDTDTVLNTTANSSDTRHFPHIIRPSSTGTMERAPETSPQTGSVHVASFSSIEDMTPKTSQPEMRRGRGSFKQSPSRVHGLQRGKGSGVKIVENEVFPTLEKKRKNVSVAYFNVKGFHSDAMFCVSEGVMVATHAEIFSTILHAVASHKGLPDCFSGDRMFGTFNAFSMVPSHGAQCLKSALLVKDGLASLKVAQLVTVTCCSGEGKVLHLGCNGMKKVTLHSTVLPWAAALERYVRKGEYTLVCDQYTAKCTEGYTMKLLDAFSFAKRSPEMLLAYEVLTEGENQNQEWMYQLEATHRNNPYTAWNEMLTALFEKRFDEAAQVVRDIPEDFDPVWFLNGKKDSYISAMIMYLRTNSFMETVWQ